MVDLAKLHEKETFSLCFSVHTGGDVISHLMGHGANQEDDFFYMDSDFESKPWLSSSVWTVDCFLEQKLVSPNESLVDRLDIDYLFSSLPIECFQHLLHIIEASASKFHAEVYYAGARISLERIKGLRDEWLLDLDREVAEKPGSEALAILIQELFYQ